jgi:pyrroloquinoline quinone biosynthesis protein B
MKALVLGAAAGGGFPQWNCRCAVCALYWAGDRRTRRRTQSSVAISRDGSSWTLLNASPDIGAQIAATPALWPSGEGRRHSPIVSVVLTNADIDHVAGLLSLRERQNFDLVALPAVHEALAMNPIFDVISSAKPIKAAPGELLQTRDGLAIEIFPVPGKVPLYLETDDLMIGSEAGETAGVLVRDGGQVLAYIPGCAELSPRVLEKLAEADAILFDGTLFTDDEMIRAGVGEKSGRRMGHVPMTGPGGSLGVLSGLSARRKIYVHINNTNPVLIDGSPERAEVERAGLEVAYDGMEVEL